MWIIVTVLAGFALAITPAPARSAPATPLFGPTIDDYADYYGQDTCDPTPKPGVVSFKDLLQQTYGVHSWGITRSCDTAGVSEHEEGRALDYHFDYYSDVQRAQADDLLGWLLATDIFGNTHAMARRLGLMYIIWNGQIWESYRPFDGWQAYSGSNPHTDHIHFSFSWPGALAQTTWWTGALIPSPPLGQLGDVDGDGRLDVATFGVQLAISRNTSTVGAPARLPAQQIPGDWSAVADPVLADWNDDGKADILGRQGGQLNVWLSDGTLNFAAPVPLGPIERYLQPADFDGDGRVDLASLSADGATLSITRNTLDGLSTLDAEMAGLAAARQLTAVDWDADGKADLLGQEGGALKVWLGRGDATFADPVILGAAARYLPPADFDGDGKPDLAVLTDDASHLVVSGNTSTAGLPSLAAGQPVIGGWATMHQLLPGDFDGDGRADITGRSGGVLQVWLSNSTSAAYDFMSYVALTRRPAPAGELG
ncbi:FG-GAP repeat domain-containing protein [Rhizocola hellebori]|nr:VCBS repeat-containing protein [Rhizocola hellebori]